MLLFYCTDCKEMITADDDESTNQIADWLDEHITKCPLATFTYEGTTNVARRRIGGLRSFLEDERLAGKESQAPFLRRASLYLAVAFELPGTILGGLLVGYLLDNYFGTSPWLLITTTLLAFAGAFV
jgi:F0F1-type ATP synthase assembly protein I